MSRTAWRRASILFETLEDRRVLATFDVTVFADSADGTCDAHCSLREAIIAAEAAPGHDTIQIPAGAYVLSLTGDDQAGGDLDITTGMTLQGAGADVTTIDANAIDRVFDVHMATVKFQDLSVVGGKAFLGGGLYNSGGVVTVINSMFAHNEATCDGGAIFVNNIGFLSAFETTFHSNAAACSGGAIYSDIGAIGLTNSTVSGNTATLDGGGIYAGASDAVISSTTIANNTAGNRGGGIFRDSGDFRTRSTIVAGNIAPAGSDVHGSLNSQGFNLFGNSTDLAGSVESDLKDLDAKLDQLQNNGGTVLTHELLVGSPAIDAGDDPDARPLDQRGRPRIIDGDGDGTAKIDIGSVEVGTTVFQWAGDIPDGTVWTGPDIHHVTADARVPAGSTLTIEPGAIVKLGSFSVDLKVEGLLHAAGTELKPIVFTEFRDDIGGDTNGNGSANSPAANSWGRIEIVAGGTATIEHADVRFGGFGASGLIDVNGGELTLRNSFVHDASTDGVRVRSANPTLENNRYEKNQGAAIRMDLASNPAISGVVVAHNQTNGLRVDAGTMLVDGFWDDPDIVYVTDGDITVEAGTKLTLAAGQVVKLGNYQYDLIVNGTLDAQGSAANPVVLTEWDDDAAGGDTNNNGDATSPQPNNWGRVELAGPNNVLTHVDIRYGGFASPGQLFVNGGGLTYTDGNVERSQSAGIRIENGDPTITRVALRDNIGAAVSMDLASNPTITGSSPVVASGNSVNGLLIDAGTMSVDGFWDDPDIVYVTNGDITVEADKKLTIAEGQVVKFGRFNYDLIVNGTLDAQGTAARPIVLTEWDDDLAGGDTNNNGAATLPKPNNWGRIELLGPSNVLSHVNIRYGGFASPGQLFVNGGDLTYADGSVEHSSSAGIRVANSSPTISRVAFRNNLGAAMSMDLASNPTITGSSPVVASGNSVNGLLIDAGTMSVDGFWDDPDIVYVTAGDITVEADKKLTLAAGQVVKFGSFQYDLTVKGTLDARGTLAKPITFTELRDDSVGGDTNNNQADSQPAPNAFGRIELAGPNNVMSHVDIRYGGFSSAGQLFVNGGSLSFTDGKVERSSSAGIRIANSNPTIARVALRDNIGAAMSMDLNSNPTITGSSPVVATGNSVNGMLVDAGMMSVDGFWDDPDIVYVTTGDITVEADRKLTLAAGQVVKFGSFQYDLTVNGTLDARGTLAKPITFTELRDDSVGGDTNNNQADSLPAPNAFGRIELVGPNNVMSHVDIRYGGFSSPGQLFVNGGSLDFTDGKVERSQSAGIRIANSNPTITRVALRDNIGAAMSMDLASNPTITGSSPVVASGNSVNGLLVDSGMMSVDGFWDDPDVVYVTNGDITVDEGKKLTVAPRQIIKFGSFSHDLIVHGTLNAQGTGQQPITFTSLADDTVGGDTNGDSARSTPGPNQWGRVGLTGTANRLQHVHMRYGGFSSAGMLQADGGDFELSESWITRSSSDGVHAATGANVKVQNSIINQNNRDGVESSGAATLSAINNTIDGNQRGAVTTGAGSTLNLTNNLITFHSVAGVASVNEGAASLTFNDVFNPNASAGNYSGLDDATGSANNRALNPRYVSRQGKTFQLGNGSPAVDSGTSQGASANDFLGKPRFDDPNSPNLGGGFPDFFDRGAVERQEVSFSDVDLVTRAVIGPTAGALDDVATISWSVQNLGEGPAFGPWHDGVYLSRDGRWSPDDRLLGSVERETALGPGQSYDATLDVTLSAIIPGDYYFIVRSNSRSEVFEGNAVDNNASASESVIRFQIEQLALGVPINAAFGANGESHYYQVTAPANTALRIELDSEGTNGATEVYVSRNAVPTRSHFDFKASGGLRPDQTLTIPTSRTGTYFILVYARYGAAAANPYTILANQAGLGIHSATPSQGGNTGPVTIDVHGTRFDRDALLTLVASDGTEIPAQRVQFENAAQVHATFDLDGARLDHYDLRVASQGQVQVLADAFQVMAGAAPDIRATINVPRAVRPGREARITIEYSNAGDTDVIAPLIVVVASNGSLRWPDSPIYLGQSVEVLGISDTGPAGVLPPGKSGRVELLFLPSIDNGPADFDLFTSTQSDVRVEWDDRKEMLRPGYISADVWDSVFNLLIDEVGQTYRDYNASLASTATYLSEFGQRVADADRLLAFKVTQAGGWLGGRSLVDEFDMHLPSGGLPIDFTRSYALPIDDRYALGLFGRGWRTLWETVAEIGASGDVTIVSTRGREYYAAREHGAFASAPGSTAELRRSATGYRLKREGGTVLGFNLAGQLTFIEDLRGSRITLTYTDGRLASIANANGDTLSLAYNEHSRVASLTGSDGHVATYAYDVGGEHLLNATSRRGTVQYEYLTNTSGALEHALASVERNGVRRSYEYDERGRLVREHDAAADEVVLFAYAEGAITTTSAFGSHTVFFDDRGNVGQVVDAAGNTTRMHYNSAGLLTEQVEADGSSSSYQYDAVGRLTSIVDGLGNRSSVSMDPITGALTQVQASNGNSLHHRIDEKGNLTSITHADGSTKLYAYDDAGNLVQSTNRRGESIHYEYNARGQMTSKVLSNGQSTTFTYDSSGSFVGATTTEGTIAMTYDEQKRLVRVTYPNGRFVAYTYDAAGRRTSLRDQDGSGALYAYDLAGRLQEVRSLHSELLTRFEYDNQGRLSNQSYGNGTSVAYTYDSQGRRETITQLGLDDAPISQLVYAYDLAGRTIRVESDAGTTRYAYDASGRLAQASLADGRVIDYSYDGNGNRQAMVVDGASTTYEANNLNQYVSIGDTSYVYDADGNLVSKTVGAERTDYRYDVEGRLIAVTSPEHTWTYEYNALGQREAMTFDGTRTEYLIDPFGLGNVIGEYDANGIAQVNYVYGNGLISQERGGEPAYYHFDRNGNTTALSNASGDIVNRYSYLPFGEVEVAAELVENPYQFIGAHGVAQDATGLQFARARYLDPAMGRFTQPDPIHIHGGINLYEYANGNPIDQIDPSGLMTVSEADSLAGALDLLIAAGWHLADIFRHRLSDAQLVRVRDVMRVGGLAVGLTVLSQLVGEMDDLPERQRDGVGQFLSLLGFYAGLEAMVASGGAVGGAASIAAAGVTSTLLGGAGALLTGISLGQFIDKYWPDNFVGSTMRSAFEFGFDFTRGVGSIWGKVQQIMRVVTSRDPNDILGPAGYGDESWLVPGSLLPYTIRFENAADAEAPAQEVFLENQLDPNMDWSTFELDEIGFGSTTVAVPEGLQEFETTVSAQNEDGSPLSVHIQVEMNPETGLIKWTYRSLDPGTGLLPDDAFAGFLPANDASGRGEGFVRYSIRAKKSLKAGDKIRNSASIVFDTNEPILTNVHVNTIDDGTPSSTVLALANTSRSPFTVSWSGQDESGGSGVAIYDIYVSDDAGAFELWLAGTDANSAEFTGEEGHTYRFYSVATDQVGHMESKNASAEATTMVVAGPRWQNLNNRLDANNDGFVAPNDALVIINILNQTTEGLKDGPLPTTGPIGPPPFIDVNGDGFVAPNDVLLIINFLNSQANGEGEMRSDAGVATDTTSRWFAYSFASDLSQASSRDEAGTWRDRTTGSPVEGSPFRRRLQSSAATHFKEPVFFRWHANVSRAARHVSPEADSWSTQALDELFAEFADEFLSPL